MRTLVVLLSGGLLLLIAGCAGGQAGMNMGGSQAAPIAATGAAASPVPGAATVNVILSEYVVSVDTATVHKGPVHLVVSNTGLRPHELRLYPQSAAGNGEHDMASGAIPGTIGLLQLIPAGTTAVLDVILPGGTWELACHLQDSTQGVQFDHYDKGMKTALKAA